MSYLNAANFYGTRLFYYTILVFVLFYFPRSGWVFFQSFFCFQIRTLHWNQKTPIHISSRWQVSSEEAKKRISINTNHSYHHVHLHKPVSTDLTIKSDSVFTNTKGKLGVFLLKAARCNQISNLQRIFIVTPSLEGRSTKAKEASSHELRLALLDSNLYLNVFYCLNVFLPLSPREFLVLIWLISRA